jgi:uncharacterized protein YqeY
LPEAIAVLRDEINAALKDAMKAKDARRVSTLRLVNAAIMERETRGTARIEATDADIREVLQKMIKQRQESADIYEKGGRPELAQQEREEMAIISGYLPRQMSEEEAKAAIAAAIKDTAAASVKDMGKVMAALKERHAGQMDFSKASGLVKGMLG